LTDPYFHDDGAGLGASHQTGSTGPVAPQFHVVGLHDSEKLRADLAGRVLLLRDLMNPTTTYERHGDDLAARGLYLDMRAWATTSSS
jgi:hypothetical protein